MCMYINTYVRDVYILNVLNSLIGDKFITLELLGSMIQRVDLFITVNNYMNYSMQLYVHTRNC